LSNLRWQK